MPLMFKNPLVALVYSPAVETDRMIHTACYSGMLSNVHECAADRLFSRKSPLIKLKPDNSELLPKDLPGEEDSISTDN
jgi:hypothetical protein